MKKISFLFVTAFLLPFISQAQLSVAKLVGKDADKYGLGYGLFTYLDFPLASANQSIRIELADFAFFPSKGESFFTTTADAKAYLSIKLGYKYVFSEAQAGFYLEPSAGYCRVVDVREGQDATYGDGISAALEGGYTLLIGQNGHSINFGLKYETDRGGTGYVLSTVGFRVSYAFNLFRKKE